MCVVYVCVFVRVCAFALFLSFLCLTTEWEKSETEYREIERESEEEKQTQEKKKRI